MLEFLTIETIITVALTAFTTILLYQIIGYAIHANNLVPEPITTEEDSGEIHTLDYLPKTHNIKNLKDFELTEDVISIINKPITSNNNNNNVFYSVFEAHDVLMNRNNNKYLDFEFGYGWDNSNILHVHHNTIFKNCSPNYLKFWFENMCNGKGKYHWYKWWHPIDHIRAWYDDNEIHPKNDNKNGYIGHTKYVYEYLCKEFGQPMDYLKIHFINPISIGFKINDINNKNIREIICARIGIMNFQVDCAYFIHFFEQIPNTNNCILKSRFWVGQANAHNTIPIPFRWILNILYKFPFMRKLMIPKDQGKRMLMHCNREMNNLATFLPQVYEKYHNINPGLNKRKSI